MGALIQAIIRFITGLFGGGSDAPAASLPAGGGAAPSSGGMAASAGGAATEEEEEDPADEEFREIQQMIAHVEGGGLNLNGMNWQDPKAVWTHQFMIEDAQGQGQTADQGAQALGYDSHDHFQLVNAYVTGKWSRLGVDEDGDKTVIIDDQLQNAMMEARMGMMQNAQAAAVNADPTLLEPVEGVSVDVWAAAAAGLSGLGANGTPAQVVEILGQHGMDSAKWDAVNAGWQAKMQGDVTGAIATKFGAAFTGAKGVDAGGAEPVTFDRFVEVMTAQEAWSAQGLDVNAQLASVFNIDAGTYGAWSGYWSPKMGTDIALTRKYTELHDHYLAKYQGAGMDDDLSL
ncbi:MAG: hypothetical protein DRJ42_11065 [Deltaproteobacteria bacterium]|nr:MAG: hypothetical protein DRJ42_11065 [Deltaproteobacteria bacterium]